MSAQKANSNDSSYHSWTTTTYSLPLKFLLLSSLTSLMLGLVLGDVGQIANVANSASRAVADSQHEEQALSVAERGRSDVSLINWRPGKDEVILPGDANKFQGHPSPATERTPKTKSYWGRFKKAFKKLMDWIFNVLRIRSKKSGNTAQTSAEKVENVAKAEIPKDHQTPMKEVGPVQIREHHPAPVERTDLQVIQDKESQANDEQNMYREHPHQDQEKYTEIPKHHLALLDDKDTQFFRTKNFIVNDEHNVYRALAHLQYQDQEKYALVKDEIEEYIRTNPLKFTKYQMTESDNKEVYPHKISVGGIEYGKMNEHGT
ncbi:hypothetical protein PGT21_017928 [Puccinia graminis f. sp. tritici]|uniref:Uncharacterized protein n=1 Tax=Puccinia graminis f. sp. tritici TaxID=56615 RepID=A0A5B0M1A6_PUCGR|nr:hypothetical protein PGT21_017928 [Puccinia graminis f. sp. tritici]KAA1089793.1 hypothetical protein PGTUg99_012296 [Puccinia graminis f. sp. tritici]